MINIESLKDRYNVEKREEWRRWCEEIPELQFPSSWNVKIIPPFGGAMVRFIINEKISVYLDCYDSLGFMGEPYWEIYPYCDDTWRCPMNNTDLFDFLTFRTKSKTFCVSFKERLFVGSSRIINSALL